MTGYLAIVLHAHLPFVRHPENEIHLEELWLYEAIAESYLPLLGVLERLEADAVRARFTISVSPTLMAMLDDPLLRARFTAHLERTLALCDREVQRTADAPAFAPLARMYRARYRALHDAFEGRYQRDILSQLARHHQAGRCELITAAGTHPLLPLLDRVPTRRAHIDAAVGAFCARFGFAPRGLWLPECAFAPGLEPLLADAGILFTVVDHHGLIHARPAPPHGHLSPVTAPEGVSFFGRDPLSSKQVWSATEGYPGDFDYREFYRDIGFDLPLDALRPLIHPDGVRTATGLKYHRITGHAGPKRPYDPARAHDKARAHAHHFIDQRRQQLAAAAPAMDRPPLLVCPYDAELFGHWWFEGPDFLEATLRAAADAGLHAISPGDYLEAHPVNACGVPDASSWGEEGYFGMWLDQSNDWLYRHLHRAEERMCALANHFPETRGVRLRVLKQAARELMLAQASDWSFIIRTGTAVAYALDRVRRHLDQFNRLDEMLSSDCIDLDALARLERRAPLFPDLDHHLFEG